MGKEELRAELEYIFSSYLNTQGFDLVELIYHCEGKDLVLRILSDRPQGGITMEECTRINREISGILDEKDIIPGRYILEVASPGLDRPLIVKSDFSRCLNRRIRIFLREAVNGKLEWEGLIKQVDDNALTLDIEGQVLAIPLSVIAKAKQLI